MPASRLCQFSYSITLTVALFSLAIFLMTSSGRRVQRGPPNLLDRLSRPDSLPHTEATLQICAVFYTLRNLGPENPSDAPTPFELLQLDPLAPPFHPPQDSARPGTRYYNAVKHEVIEAGKKIRAAAASPARMHAPEYPPRDGGTGDSGDIRGRGNSDRADLVLRASWSVTDMLLSDDTRAVFLDKVQPRLTSWVAKVTVIEGLCGAVWMERGWDV
ncbi:hypothetical protein ColLi_12203 [Colletotrichum liriopes]|uniref:Uncharacterized protein n=1 Tax=Colletotrichum liriopes TaxID=708192 RepID=A0AA37LXQ1_9PEZI|nr:hypothetical protein ColLi_12203 [Colletotrichum liriopes]